MQPVQQFCLKNIYASPKQDEQFSIQLHRVNKVDRPFIRIAHVYNVVKKLPNAIDFFHVFVIGHIRTKTLNLLSQQKDWFRDVWIRFDEDMVLRNYVPKIYNDKGYLYPLRNCYYSFIDENSLVVAIRTDAIHNNLFDIKSFNYLHLYSNEYFNIGTFSRIDYMYSIAHSNIQKVQIQEFIEVKERLGGKCLIYVNGMYTEKLSLLIPDGSVVEVVYDPTIQYTYTHRIDSLRTFSSIKDNRLKYLIFNNSISDVFYFHDDVEFYVTTSTLLNNTGVFFYKHKDYVVRNVTDKDYSITTSYINNTAELLNRLYAGGIDDKQIVLYVRKTARSTSIVHSSLRLHELYKLPYDVQLNTLLGSAKSIPNLRAENLENSDYFSFASEKDITKLTSTLSTNVLGYDAITYYFGYSYASRSLPTETIPVPPIYRHGSTVFEYDIIGRYISNSITTDKDYIPINPAARHVEFVYGTTPSDFGKLYTSNEVILLKHNEYTVLSADFIDTKRITEWVDITLDTSKVNEVNNTLQITEHSTKKIKVIYSNEINVYGIQVPLTLGALYFPITIQEDRGTGILLHRADIPYLNIEVFLNGYKLVHNLDYFINFPYISICNKKYIDYTLQQQNVHVRAYGFTLSKYSINKHESSGFINHGVLSRNSVYDIRDDRAFNIYVDGLLRKRSNVRFAENDTQPRIDDVGNGLPYSLKESYMSIKPVTGLNTREFFTKAKATEEVFSTFFTALMPEEKMPSTNVILTKHKLFSPTISKIIHDMLDGNIPAITYTSPYNDVDLVGILDNLYSDLLLLDPVRNLRKTDIVEIHPHLGNTIVNLNLFQYRFLQNIVRVITTNASNTINLSGYVSVTV